MAVSAAAAAAAASSPPRFQDCYAVWNNIALYMAVPDICRSRRACTSWASNTHDFFFWEQLIARDCGPFVTAGASSPSSSSSSSSPKTLVEAAQANAQRLMAIVKRVEQDSLLLRCAVGTSSSSSSLSSASSSSTSLLEQALLFESPLAVAARTARAAWFCEGRAAYAWSTLCVFHQKLLFNCVSVYAGASAAHAADVGLAMSAEVELLTQQQQSRYFSALTTHETSHFAPPLFFATYLASLLRLFRDEDGAPATMPPLRSVDDFVRYCAEEGRQMYGTRTAADDPRVLVLEAFRYTGVAPAFLDAGDYQFVADDAAASARNNGNINGSSSSSSSSVADPTASILLREYDAGRAAKDAALHAMPLAPSLPQDGIVLALLATAHHSEGYLADRRTQNVLYDDAVSSALLLRLAGSAEEGAAAQQLQEVQQAQQSRDDELLLLAMDHSGPVLHQRVVDGGKAKTGALLAREVSGGFLDFVAALRQRKWRKTPLLTMLLLHNHTPVAEALSAVARLLPGVPAFLQAAGAVGRQQEDRLLLAGAARAVIHAPLAVPGLSVLISWAWMIIGGIIRVVGFFLPDIFHRFFRNAALFLLFPLVTFSRPSIWFNNIGIASTETPTTTAPTSWLASNSFLLTALVMSVLTQAVGLRLVGRRAGLGDDFFRGGLGAFLLPVQLSTIVFASALPMEQLSQTLVWISGALHLTPHNISTPAVAGNFSFFPGGSGNDTAVLPLADRVFDLLSSQPPRPAWNFTSLPLHQYLPAVASSVASASSSSTATSGIEAGRDMPRASAVVGLCAATSVVVFVFVSLGRRILRAVKQREQLEQHVAANNAAAAAPLPFGLGCAACGFALRPRDCNRCAIIASMRFAMSRVTPRCSFQTTATSSSSPSASTPPLDYVKSVVVRQSPTGVAFVRARLQLQLEITVVQALQAVWLGAAFVDMHVRGATCWETIFFVAVNDLLCRAIR